MENEMKAFYENKAKNELKIKEQKQKYAKEVVHEIDEKAKYQNKLRNLKTVKAKRSKEFNLKVDEIYLK